MKKTLQIARMELGLLFYSPIAWLLILALFFEMVLPFVALLDFATNMQEVYKFDFSFLTANIFTLPNSGMFGRILTSLYLYLPLLTMGLIAREFRSGSVSLLYSSPVRVSQIILGKFLAMLFFCAIMTLVLASVAILLGGLTIGHFDYPLVLVALLGAFLLLCAYSAIGIFVSCLTSYQVAAAIYTFMAFAFLNYIGHLWQGIDLVRDLTWCLSMPGRAEKMLKGLLTTREVFYFLIIIGIFLLLAICRLQMAREGRSAWYKAGRFTAIILVGLLAGYLSSRPRYIGYYDATATKVNTLLQNSQELLRQMGDAPLEVTQYVNLLDGMTYDKGAPDKRLEDFDRWEPYIRFKPGINLHYVYYYDNLEDSSLFQAYPGKTLAEIAADFAKGNGISLSRFLKPEEIRKVCDLRGENNRLVMQLQYKGRKTFLRVFDDTEFWPGEAETGAALKRLLVEPPKVLFVTGGYERSIEKIGDKDYMMLTNLKTFRRSLINQGFDVDTVGLPEGTIPKGIAALAIADPRVEFDPVSMGKIRQYIQEGGNLLVAGEPGKQEIVNHLLQPLGVRMKEGTLVQQSKDFTYDMTTPYLTGGGATLHPILLHHLGDSVPVTMPGVSGLEYDSNSLYRVWPVLQTDASRSWNKMGILVLDSAALQYEPGHGDQLGSYPTMLALTRKAGEREQRILVSGDADFISNKELNRTNLLQFNFDMANAIFGWFSYGAFPVDATRPPSKDIHLIITARQVWMIRVLYLGVIPGIILLLGTVLLIRRKRK